MNVLQNFQAIDLFCGIGGLSYGLKQGGIQVVVGLDNDASCSYAYEKNIEAPFLSKDITSVTKDELQSYYAKDKRRILVGCAPCQPFSIHSYKNLKMSEKVLAIQQDERWKLLYEFQRLIEELTPEIISMENVPQLVKHKVFQDFVRFLEDSGYYVSNYQKIVYCPDYGIPQKRQRLVLLASKLGEIELLPTTHNKEDYVTVQQTIGDLPEITDGETCNEDLLHRTRKLSPKNKERIKNLKEGESWVIFKNTDLENLISPCHLEKEGKRFTGVYARMSWKQVAPTITTHCIGLSNGRFGHPEQDRAISLREAALLQSFPQTYQFVENANYNIANVARHIGNAVPPKLGEIIAKSIQKHIISIENE